MRRPGWATEQIGLGVSRCPTPTRDGVGIEDSATRWTSEQAERRLRAGYPMYSDMPDWSRGLIARFLEGP